MAHYSVDLRTLLRIDAALAGGHNLLQDEQAQHTDPLLKVAAYLNLLQVTHPNGFGQLPPNYFR